MLLEGFDVFVRDIGSLFALPASPVALLERRYECQFVSKSVRNEVEQSRPLEHPPNGSDEPVDIAAGIPAGKMILEQEKVFFAESRGIGIGKEFVNPFERRSDAMLRLVFEIVVFEKLFEDFVQGQCAHRHLIPFKMNGIHC